MVEQSDSLKPTPKQLPRGLPGFAGKNISIETTGEMYATHSLIKEPYIPEEASAREKSI